MNRQKRLSEYQVAEFFHTEFEADQVHDFESLLEDIDIDGSIVDVGGGIGKFARLLAEGRGNKIRVLDIDARSVEIANDMRNAQIEALVADATNPPFFGDEILVTINLILHHLIGDTESVTRDLQESTLRVWRGKAKYIFINEYIYESFFGNVSGRLIYQITSSSLLSSIASFVAKFAPSLRANTFGVGVRFRSNSEWVEMFNRCGFELVGMRAGLREQISLPRRLLLISQIKRNSYLIRSKDNLRD